MSPSRKQINAIKINKTILHPITVYFPRSVLAAAIRPSVKFHVHRAIGRKDAEDWLAGAL